MSILLRGGPALQWSRAAFVAPGGTQPPASTYFNSAEPGGDGSNTDYVLADNFERDNWYETEEDHTNSINYGWLGNPFAGARWYDYVPTDTVTQTHPAVTVAGAGVGGNRCAQNGGSPDNTGGAGWSAYHYFAPSETEYEELYIRFYMKFLDPSTVDSLAYNSGHLKILEIENQGGGSEIGFIHSPFGGSNLAFFCTVEDGFCYGDPSANNGGMTGKTNEATNQSHYALTRNTWHFIECRIKLNTNISTADGILEMWAADAGSDGTTDITNPTKIFSYTGLDLRQNNVDGIGQIYLEGWLPSSGGASMQGSVHIYWDQLIVSKSLVGPMSV